MGTGLGVALVIIIGFMGFIVLSLIWFMTGPKDRAVAHVELGAGDHHHPARGG